MATLLPGGCEAVSSAAYTVAVAPLLSSRTTV
jgi:hypothetical protein